MPKPNRTDEVDVGPIDFGRVGRRVVEGRFDGVSMTSDGGVMLYVFCGPQLPCAYLRPSRIDAAQHSAAILKLLVKRLRQAWPGVRIVFRGDSGFCRQLHSLG